MDPGKKPEKVKPRDERSRNYCDDRFTNSGKFYPSHKVDSIEMLSDEEKGNSDLDCDTQLSFPPPAMLMDVDEPKLSENSLRQKMPFDILGGQCLLSEQDLFMETASDSEPEFADAANCCSNYLCAGYYLSELFLQSFQ
jgi:hypothetical protein